MATDIYIQLSYDEYKELENQLLRYKQIETSHKTVEGFYHKAFRLRVGEMLFEFQGPLVKEPKHDQPAIPESDEEKVIRHCGDMSSHREHSHMDFATTRMITCLGTVGGVPR